MTEDAPRTSCATCSELLTKLVQVERERDGWHERCVIEMNNNSADAKLRKENDDLRRELGIMRNRVQMLEPYERDDAEPDCEQDDIQASEISTRARNIVLEELDCRTFTALSRRHIDDVRYLKNCGKETIRCLRAALAARGLRFRGDPPDAYKPAESHAFSFSPLV